MKANIYVPRCGSAAERIVASKSAIVGRPKANTEFVHCYFEGNLYGAVNLERFADRLGAAADRMRDDYPTTSVATFSSDSLVNVGEYDLERLVITRISNARALEDWSGEPADMITGRKLPCGTLAWNEAETAMSEGSIQIARLDGGDTYVFRTRAGQVLMFDASTHQATAYDHDDPGLRGMLADHLGPADRRIVFGVEDHQRSYSGF